MALDDQVRRLVRSLIEERQLAAVSRRLGRNHAYLFQYLNQGKPRVLPEGIRLALAKETGRPPDDFLPPEMRRQPAMENIDGGLRVRAEAVADRLVGPQDDPVMNDIRTEVAATVYVLLQNERNNIPISDNEVTLRPIELLIRRILSRIRSL